MILDKESRVLIPILVWSMLVPLIEWLKADLPVWIFKSRYLIAGYLLGWGWVVLHYRAEWERAEAKQELETAMQEMSDKVKNLEASAPERQDNGKPES